MRELQDGKQSVDELKWVTHGPEGRPILSEVAPFVPSIEACAVVQPAEVYRWAGRREKFDRSGGRAVGRSVWVSKNELANCSADWP